MIARFFHTTSLILTAGTVLLASSMSGTVNAAITTTKDSSLFDTKNWEGDSVPAAIYGVVASPEWTSDGSNYVIVQDGVPGMAGSSGAFSAATGWTVEWRMKMDTNNLPSACVITAGALAFGRASMTMHLADDSSLAGHFQIPSVGQDGGGEYVVFDAASDAILYQGGDITEFLTVRLAVEGTGGDGQIRMYVDTVHVGSPPGTVGAYNRQWFGAEGAVVSSGTAIVDYFRYDTTGAYAPIPEPTTIALLGIGLALVPIGRRSATRRTRM